jgi:CRISPR-associated endonuclease/helicase Cas3
MGDSRGHSSTASFRVATGGFTPYRWQVQVAVDGLPDVLPVPTGLGTTEVALAWAWRLLVDKKAEPLHLVICLPMRSLVTQTVQRLAGYFEALRAKKPAIDVDVHQLMGGAVDKPLTRSGPDGLKSLGLGATVDLVVAVVGFRR